jgi:filamentous hemagglutinin family protein
MDHFGSRATLGSIAVACCLNIPAFANPTGPAVVSGTASFSIVGSTLTVTNTPNTIVNWQTFSIGAGETTRFNQQSGISSVLNRITTQNPSSILGSLQSNGRIFLVNPSGIVFGAGSRIDAAGLVASTLNLSDADFLAGRLRFTSTPGAGPVSNNGTIATIGADAPVYLIGPAVTNAGVITSPAGEVLLAAGNSVEVIDPGTPNITVQITAPSNEALNLGAIFADSGRVSIFAGLVRQLGVVQADTLVVGQDGRIALEATGGANGGTVSEPVATAGAGNTITTQTFSSTNGGFFATGAVAGTTPTQESVTFNSTVPTLITGVPTLSTGVPTLITGVPTLTTSVPTLTTGVPTLTSSVPSTPTATSSTLNQAGTTTLAPSSITTFGTSSSTRISAPLEATALPR